MSRWIFISQISFPNFMLIVRLFVFVIQSHQLLVLCMHNQEFVASLHGIISGLYYSIIKFFHFLCVMVLHFYVWFLHFYVLYLPFFYVHVCLQSVNCTLILWLLPILILLTFSVNESCVLRFQTFTVILVLIYYLLKIICNFFLGH